MLAGDKRNGDERRNRRVTVTPPLSARSKSSIWAPPVLAVQQVLVGWDAQSYAKSSADGRGWTSSYALRRLAGQAFRL